MPRDNAKLPRTSSQGGLGNPARRVFAITPADTEMAEYATALYVSAAGNLVFVPIDNLDAEIVTMPVQPGYHPVTARQVRVGTTATVFGLVG